MIQRQERKKKRKSWEVPGDEEKGRKGGPWWGRGREWGGETVRRVTASHMQRHARPFLKRLLFERIRCRLEKEGPGPRFPRVGFTSINLSVKSQKSLLSPADSPERGFTLGVKTRMFTWAVCAEPPWGH